jgi:alkanesulfonate monooxygenase SsuD/methylene tetrahydromethanopterin reductase-like flavin-dependent oxidoreductase (luciferase family)
MTMVGIRFDLRLPSFATTTPAEQYRACLDQCEWADRLGLDIVVLSEHHGVDDGFMSAPLTVAAAIAGRTTRVQINIAAVLVPLHDPVRLAEQLAALALLSGGRVGFVAGLGYRQEEFDMAGVDRRQRGKLLDESRSVMRTACAASVRMAARTVRVTPKPQSEPMLLVWRPTGSAKRAARLRAGFFPAIGDGAPG